jgi:hypothetical protein
VNPRLRALVETGTGRLADRAPRRWRHVAVMNSVGPVPLPDVARGAWHGDRGFNLLLVDGSGRPVFFCKCRDARDAAFAREADVLERLGGADGAPECLPAACGVTDGRARMLVSVYARGKVLRHLVTTMGTAEWESALEGVSRAADALSDAAPRVLGPLLERRDSLDLAAEGAPALATLGAAALDPDAIAALGRAMAAGGSVAWRPQHGDLWSSNVLRLGERWILLDFERFGLIGVPLYDVVHLARTTAQARVDPKRAWNAPPPLWTPLMLGGGADADACRRVLGGAARRHGLGPAAALGAVAYYLSEHAARLAVNGAPPTLAEPALEEVAAFASALRAHAAVDHLLGFA